MRTFLYLVEQTVITQNSVEFLSKCPSCDTVYKNFYEIITNEINTSLTRKSLALDGLQLLMGVGGMALS